ncbi:MAG: hypothetical protein FD123_3611 [Bacteroidetes bacterium]|nr:MAG: hypothetical protein FD123_3611 [Bacteroidota bacterium]
MNPIVIIQARMGSSRLPGKVLKLLAGKPQLQHLLDRLGRFTGSGSVIIATTDHPADDVLEQFCAEQEVKCFRGSEHDVLDRYYRAAKSAGASAGTPVIRVTSDCPLHHEDVVRFALDEFERHELDYFSNSFAPHYEDGCDTEVFRFDVLERARKEAKLLSQREHVTPFIKDSGLFLCGYKKYDSRYKYKLSVDTPEDHAAVEGIFEALAPKTDFTITDVVDLLQKRPDLLEANKSSVINAGYSKSLREDRKVE